MKEPVKFCFYRRHVFRNFATAIPSQDVLDDLNLDSRGKKAIQKTFYDHADQNKTPFERVMNRSAVSDRVSQGRKRPLRGQATEILTIPHCGFNKSQIIAAEINSKFKPLKWHATRYSDGSWPVLYSAESEKTAFKEVIYHLKRFYKEELETKPITLDRRVVKLLIQAQKGLDLNKQDKVQKPKLISKDKGGYPYCQKLARKYIDKGVEIFRTPSARDRGGTCVPVFNKSAIKKDYGHLKYIKIVLYQSNTIIFPEMNFE